MTSSAARATFVFSAVLLLGVFAMYSCSDDSGSGTEPEPDITDPMVSLSASSELVLSDGDVTFTADASDNEGVALVEFYENSTMISSDDTAPFAYTASYTEVDNGIHECWARAKDSSGNSADSDTIGVIVAINMTAEFTNPGFTTDGSGWIEHNFDPWSGWIADSGNPPGCYRLNEFGSYAVNPGIEQEVSGFIPGIIYQVSGEYMPHAAWIGNPSNESFVVTVDSLPVGSFPRGVNGEAWSPFVAEFTATEFTHTIGFWGEWLDDSSYDLDNVSLSIKALR